MKHNKLFYERLAKAIKKSGKSTNQIERELGYSRNALHNYKNGAEPSGTRLVELAQYFDVSPVYLMGEKSNVNYISPTNFFQQLSTEEKLEIFKISQEWAYYKVIDLDNHLK